MMTVRPDRPVPAVGRRSAPGAATHGGTPPWPWARMVAALLLGAAGIAAMAFQPEAWSENPDYNSRVSQGRTVWLASCCLAAALVRFDWRGLLAAWLGALAALPIVVPAALGGTMAGDPYWTNLSLLVGAVYSAGMLALAFGARWITGVVLSPGRAQALLVGALALLVAVAVGLLLMPAGPYSGPQPAPTYPG
jgi:hypothetical protein